ncbi:AI-2E family transporter [Idiomarina sp. X4]|uniref:AI-2E family transporter n=1 Tax=Idiomarina TaxID=135575 RepID=UPI000C283A5E|nr:MULTISPECIES: AI-2E family transporter [Idiomarina]ATZ74198.1 AI-2E family transporter [Idiomarina sp. X4]MTJ02846.1 AI-2E family transporter [Idiomarina piscisalsi]
MFDYIKQWYQRKFADPNAVTLFLLLVVTVVVIVLFGNLLAPLIVAIALAYLLDWPVTRLMYMGMSRLSATVITFVAFLALAITVLLTLVPVIWQQSMTLIQELPNMIGNLQIWLHKLPEMFPSVIDESQINELTQSLKNRVVGFGESLVTVSLTSLVNLMAMLVYLIVVPLLIFFMLKDRDVLMANFSKLLPSNRALITQVGQEMNLQIMNYIRGKVIEIIVVAIVSFVTFSLFGLQYALLLAILVGFSVLIPYIGAAVVTIPVVLVALFQFGPTAPFVWVTVAYLVIQALDGNLLVPLLFSEAVSLNPVYIIAAVLIFGGIWGFWGVFFAIPLASLVKAVITAWDTGASGIEPPAEETKKASS